MKTLFIVLTTLFLTCTISMAADGLVTKTSAHNVKQTMDNLEKIVKSKGFNVAARINHAAAAATVKAALRPTEVLIFGKPKLGTKLMQSSQTIGIDLPIKVIVWQEADGTVKLGYNDPDWLASRHSITDKKPIFEKMKGALKKITDAAVK